MRLSRYVPAPHLTDHFDLLRCGTSRTLIPHEKQNEFLGTFLGLAIALGFSLGCLSL